jgi:two-component system, OmpR family, sensor histidine kinase MtrB
MNSLRGRIIVMSALIALLTTILCSLSTIISVNNGLIQLDKEQATEQIIAFDKRLTALCEQLSYEVDDYANWDELYNQMPQPTAAWATVNLTPGKVNGALTHYLAIANQERIIGRYHDGEVRQDQASLNDPVTAGEILALVTPNTAKHGISTHREHAFIYAIAPIRPSTRTGPSLGSLVAITYINRNIMARLVSDNWQPHITTSSIPTATAVSLQKTSHHREPVISDSLASIATDIQLPQTTLTFTLSRHRQMSQILKQQITQAISLTGLLVSLLAVSCGIALGWWWLRPITQLADACARHSGEHTEPLSATKGLREADLLQSSFSDLLARLRDGQQRLSHALNQQTTANAVHRRFLSQLAHEIGQPFRLLTQTIERAHNHNGRMEPDQVAHARVLAQQLEERLHDILTLVSNEPDSGDFLSPLALDAYLCELCDLLRSRAERRHMRMEIEAPTLSIPIDPKLLSPILINLIANALNAGDHGTVNVSVTIDENRKCSQWTIRDNGPGLPTELAKQFRVACKRGEVLPGTPGLGLGLALALANVRVLGGQMTLNDTGPTGTSISVTLPLA